MGTVAAQPSAGETTGGSEATAAAGIASGATGSTTAPAGGGGGGSSTVTIEAWTLNDLVPAPDGTPTSIDEAVVQFDQPNDGDIEGPLAADYWSFTAQAGQLLGIEVIEIGPDCNQDLTLAIRDPEGSRAQVGWIGNYGCVAHGAYLLLLDGEYVFEFLGGDGSVIGDNTGTYRFVPYWLTDIDEGPITPGTLVEGAIVQPLGADRWTFTADAGQLLTVDVESIGADCNQDLRMNLVDPYGKRQELGWVGNRGCNTHGPFELERSGDHVLEFRGGNGGIIKDNLGPYTFAVTLS